MVDILKVFSSHVDVFYAYSYSVWYDSDVVFQALTLFMGVHLTKEKSIVYVTILQECFSVSNTLWTSELQNLQEVVQKVEK
jgi:hypothetical protein